MPPTTTLAEPWASVPDRFRQRGLRWTPQRRAVVEVLAASDGHVTGAELVERCRALDPSTIPSTVYRSLDVLEELGLIRHGHAADGREEFHARPEEEHGHRYCAACAGRLCRCARRHPRSLAAPGALPRPPRLRPRRTDAATRSAAAPRRLRRCA